MAISILYQPRFLAGRLVMSVGVADRIHRGQLNPVPYLRRHLDGDWGDLSDHDRRSNEAALKNGDRLFSSYRVSPTVKLWIITEADRSVTTLLLPHEY